MFGKEHVVATRAHVVVDLLTDVGVEQVCHVKKCAHVVLVGLLTDVGTKYNNVSFLSNVTI